MSDVILFHAPSSCSRVTMNALEEVGIAFEDRGVDIFTGQQKSPEYLALNPKGKVPALKIGQRVHTENAAILYFLHLQYPAAHLLPESDTHLAPNEGLEDLVWCSSTIHPMVRQVRNPLRFTDGDTAGVKAHGMQHLAGILNQVAARLSGDRWWYGNHWSILDVYLYWAYSTAAGGGMDLSAWSALGAHTARVRQRPSFVRALAREHAALERHRIDLPPSVNL